MKANFETGLKICSTCKRELPIAEYNKNKAKPDGLDKKCRECSKKHHREYYQSHLESAREVRRIYRESHREQNKQYRIDHAEEIKRKQNEWRERNKEVIKRKAKEYRQNNPELIKLQAKLKYQRDKNKVKDAQLKKKYGISLEELDKIWEAQDGKCKACGKELSRGAAGYAVDHDHDTGKFRWLLCANCNFILGHAHDSPDILLRIADMIKTGTF